MTWQSGLTIVGTAVGAYFGYPQLGALVGSLVGAEVDRSQIPDSSTSGPRLTDLKAQISSYGADIPYLFGTNRVAGNVIWSADIEEVETDTTSSAGGKGSGPTQTAITFSYFGSFAVLLAFGPCRGIRRIWGDQVLIYDGAIDPPVGNVDYVFYQGTEDQLPDPTMEAALGVDNVPGYRGYCYVVFNRLPLDKFGNRIPNITVELTADGEFSSAGTALGPNPYVGAGVDYGHLIMGGAQRSDGEVVMLTYPNCTSPTHAPGIELSLVDQFTGLKLLTVDYPSIEGSNEVIDQNLMCYVPPSNEVWVSGTGALIHRFDATTFARTGTITLFAGAAKLAYEPTTRRVYFRPDASWICAGGEFIVLGAGAFNIDVLRLHFIEPSPIYVTDCGSIGLDGTINYESMSAIIDTVPLVFLTDGAAQSHRACFDPTRRRYVAIDGRIWTITDAETPVITVRDLPVGATTGGAEVVMYDSATDSIIMQSEVVGIVTITVLDADTFALLYHGAVTGASDLGVNFSFPAAAGSLLELGSYQTWRLDYFGTTVGAAVDRLCRASGMDFGEFNVSELTQSLRGYLMAAMGPARGAIEQMSTAYLFEATEQDDVLYFRRRGGAVVATITADECGAAVDAASEFPISRDRAQEADLPARLFVAAPDPYTDYQAGSQYGERRAVNAGDDEQVQLVTVMTVTESKRLADALIFDRWASRNSRKWTTARRYTRIVPTDVVSLDGERVRVLRRSDDGPVIHWEGVTDDPDVVNQLVSGVQGTFPGQAVPIVVPSEMVVLDTALLRDDDNSPGAYVAVYGIAPLYRGTLVYTSRDAGDTWVRLATVSRPGSSVGVALTALPDWTGGNVFDEAGSVNIHMRNGTLSGTTRAGVLAGNNALALSGPDGSWEVLQYRDVTLETDGSYTLSGLLRGRRGTGWAIAGHTIGDLAVVLDTADVRNLPITNTQIGVALPFKAVSVGDSIATTPAVTETITAERLKPWSPVDLRVHRPVDSLDATVSWKRRTRLACRYTGTGGINVPLGEDAERYDVEIVSHDGLDIIRTLFSLTEPQFTYTAAQQIDDGFPPGDAICMRIYQLSAIVGRGHPFSVCTSAVPTPIYIPSIPEYLGLAWEMQFVDHAGVANPGSIHIGEWAFELCHAIRSPRPGETDIYYYLSAGVIHSKLFADESGPVSVVGSSNGTPGNADASYAFGHEGIYVNQQPAGQIPTLGASLTADEDGNPISKPDPGYTITAGNYASAADTDVGPRNFDLYCNGVLAQSVRELPVWDGGEEREFLIKHVGLNYWRLHITSTTFSAGLGGASNGVEVSALEMYGNVGGADLCAADSPVAGFGDSDGCRNGTQTGDAAFGGGAGWVGRFGAHDGNLRFGFFESTPIVQYGIRVDATDGSAPYDWTFDVSVDGVRWIQVDRRERVVLVPGVLTKFTLLREVLPA